MNTYLTFPGLLSCLTGISVFWVKMTCLLHSKSFMHNYGEYLYILVLYDNNLAGITVAYSAPTRHGCLKVVENNYCASRRGMVPCPSMIFPLLSLYAPSNYGINIHLTLEHYRWRPLSIHLESYLFYHLWSSCLISGFKSPDIHEQLLYTSVLVL